MRDSADGATHDSEPRAFSIPEAAKLLSLGTRKVEYMIQSGELKSIKIGRSRRIPRKVLEDFLEEKQKLAS
ncbi:helix-turn-helix domain-containing protein [Micromonospora chokoriensis]|uniref:helix-turn-helix domain-containing protein n=1 Tax=Micromonospora chokoriensis TaxID=356851 RepID=UPI0004C44EE0|nr:helix-turn-helix domain-containing protein [Micromonospora chokoriensis]